MEVPPLCGNGVYVKRALLGPRRSTPLEPVGVLPGGTAGVGRGVEPALPGASVDNGPPAVVDAFADEESIGVFAGNDGGGIGVELAILPEAGPLAFRISFRFPFP
jgi:hypothetical protein